MLGYRHLWGKVLLAGCLVSCGSPEPEKADYFPVEKGIVREFEVNETRYSITEPPRKSTWFLREVIGASVEEINGFSVYKLERYRRNQMADNWQIDSVWTVYRQPDKIVRVENNTPFVKFLLPPANGLSWNGNALNTFAEQTYRMKTSADRQWVEVVQMADSSLVHLNKSVERYEAGLGMVYREIRVYHYCQSTSSCIGQNIIASGRDQVLKMIR